MINLAGSIDRNMGNTTKSGAYYCLPHRHDMVRTSAPDSTLFHERKMILFTQYTAVKALFLPGLRSASEP